MKTVWGEKPLGELIEKLETINPKKNPESSFEYIDVSSVSKITNKIEETQTLKGADAPSRARRMVRTNDVIFATIRPTLKRIAIVPMSLDQAICSTGYMVLRAKREIDPKFLYYYLFGGNYSEAMERLQKGASYPAVTDGQVRAQPIPLPPHDEQKRIVAVLEAAFEGLDRARAHVEANLQNARDLFDVQSVKLLSERTEGWIDRKLSEVCEKITDGTHQTPTYFDEGFIFLSSRNVKDKKINWENIKYIDQVQHDAMQKRISPRVGDVLLAKNGTTGVAAIVDREVVFDIYVSLAHLRALDLLLPNFLLHFVNSPLAKVQFNSRLKGQGVPNLHLKEIREVQISFPEAIENQQKIVENIEALVSATDSLKTSYQAKLTDLDDLRQSLLQKAFAGELT